MIFWQFVEEKDYFSVIISSLPFDLSNFASIQLAAAQFSSSKSVSPDDLLFMLMEESDRQRAHRQRIAKSPGRAREDVDEALHVGQSQAGKGKGRFSDVTCWNCDSKGHIARFSKEPKPPKDDPPNGTSAPAVEWESEREGACRRSHQKLCRWARLV